MMLLKQTIIRGKVNKILYIVQLLPLREAAGEAFSGVFVTFCRNFRGYK